MSRRATTRGERYDSRLARNVRALIDHQADGSVNRWSTRYNLPQSTINKIANGSRGATVEQLEEIQSATGFAAWQLLHPDFSPKTMPPMTDAGALRVAAIYAGIQDSALKFKAAAIMEQFDESELAPTESGTTEQRELHR